MSNEHTPGPWRIEPTISPTEKYICADKPEGQVELARVYDWAEYTGGEGLSLPAEANARLIAAAPELDAYRRYIEDDMVRRGGWTTLRFDEFRDSEECAYYMKEEVR